MSEERYAALGGVVVGAAIALVTLGVMPATAPKDPKQQWWATAEVKIPKGTSWSMGEDARLRCRDFMFSVREDGVGVISFSRPVGD